VTAVTRFSCCVLVAILGLTTARTPSAASGVRLQPNTTSQQRPPDIYFVGTPQPIVDAMLRLARVTSEDVVYDLGSGDGRIVILAAQKYAARGVGIEIDPQLVARSREIAREAGVEDKVSIIEGDLFKADVSAATVVTLWLSASINAQLEPILKRQLRPGARIVSHQFPMGDWAPAERVGVRDVDVFLWRVPERVPLR
jgi:SAM-dependent methyltransferase